MTTLYNLTDAFWKALRAYEEDETEDKKLEDVLDEISNDLDDKLEDCVGYYKNLLAEQTAFKAESKRLKEKADTIADRAESLKKYMAHCLHGESWAKGIHKLVFRRSESLDVIDLESIPEVYIKEKITYSPDKIEMKNVIKAGGTIPGVAIKENFNLQVK